MLTYTGQGIVEFFGTFKSDYECLKYLADRKWNPENGGFKCSKCGHNKFTIRKKNLARDCSSCHHVESPTAGTMFHRVRFGLQKAFYIVHSMSCKSRGISATQMATELKISRPTAWLFMHKVRISMASRESTKAQGKVQVKALAYGWKEDFRAKRSHSPKRKKIVSSIEINEKRQIVQCHFKHIENYSAKELGKIFKSHISAEAHVITEKWTGFKPLENEYKIEQQTGSFLNFKQTNYVIHHLKTWFRSTYTWVHPHHMQGYLDEFSFKINRSSSKENIFDSLILRMISAKPLLFKDIRISN
jgi:hypothetical protein